MYVYYYSKVCLRNRGLLNYRIDLCKIDILINLMIRQWWQCPLFSLIISQRLFFDEKVNVKNWQYCFDWRPSTWTIFIFIPCVVGTALDQQHAQYFSLDVCIISHWTFRHVSIHKGSSSGNQTKAVPHKIKSVTFIHSWYGVKESNRYTVDSSL